MCQCCLDSSKVRHYNIKYSPAARNHRVTLWLSRHTAFICSSLYCLAASLCFTTAFNLSTPPQVPTRLCNVLSLHQDASMVIGKKQVTCRQSNICARNAEPYNRRHPSRGLEQEMHNATGSVTAVAYSLARLQPSRHALLPECPQDGRLRSTEGAPGGRLVQDQPVQPELSYGFGELGKVHGLAH